MGQQPALAPQPTAETNQAAIGSNYPVAGNNDQQGILVVSLTNSSGGFRPAASRRYLAVSPGLAIGNLFKLSPDLLLKSSPRRFEFQLNFCLVPRKYSSSCCQAAATGSGPASDLNLNFSAARPGRLFLTSEQDSSPPGPPLNSIIPIGE